MCNTPWHIKLLILKQRQNIYLFRIDPIYSFEMILWSVGAYQRTQINWIWMFESQVYKVPRKIFLFSRIFYDIENSTECFSHSHILYIAKIWYIVVYKFFYCNIVSSKCKFKGNFILSCVLRSKSMHKIWNAICNMREKE